MFPDVESVPLIVRREIEARIIAPFVEALAGRFPRQKVLDILCETIVRLAREQAAGLPERIGGDDLASFGKATKRWTEGGALELRVLRQNEAAYDFDVTRCRYAEMYERLGIAELGAILSCSRDFAASEGFNPALRLTRTQTILGGAGHCDFRYRLERAAGETLDSMGPPTASDRPAGSP